jgi:D-cysteine desulfhydrase
MNISFPKSIKLSNLPTPILPLKTIWSKNSGTVVWIKRDDLTGLEVSGNKVRKLEFLLNDAIQQKATHILTCGGVQSNHCRTAAFMAAKLGLTPVLFLKDLRQSGIPEGNLLLDKLLHSEIVPVSARNYVQIDALMADRAADLKTKGQRGYCIPEGGSNHLGVWGYIRCFAEIITQIKDQSLPIDALLVATGSGGTHAGLLLGKLLFDSPLQILSVNVCDNAAICRQKIMGIIKDFNEHYGYRFSCSDDDIAIIDGFTGRGYGLIDQAEIRLIKEFARQEGIILDPVYTAKAVLGMQTLLQNGVLELKNILFIHTGGIFSIFPYAAELFGQ